MNMSFGLRSPGLFNSHGSLVAKLAVTQSCLVKNSADVEVLVSRQVVMHGWLNIQSTVWTEEYRCSSQHKVRVTSRSLQTALLTSVSARPPSNRNRGRGL